ncbi:MAG: hypothetical protein KF726_17060 [Anaerolineae bacterium]|nr:hypothetical protein [Anaerolineae bacterium]
MPARGVYKFTNFRSQLEIRFVKELEQREIKWFYEPERLGQSRYLLDFYLPQFKSWVEVKGVVDSRDHDSLLALSVMLKKERRQRVFMWLDKTAFYITEDGFKPLNHEQFWTLLTETPADQAERADAPRLIRPD